MKIKFQNTQIKAGNVDKQITNIHIIKNSEIKHQKLWYFTEKRYKHRIMIFKIKFKILLI